jgi:DNA-binding MarR family transcriptional regulator
MSDDQLGVSAFLEKKGAIGIFVRLNSDEGILSKDLVKVVDVTTSTLSKRLEEGRKRDLFMQVRKPEDHGNARRNQLTERGERLREEMESVGLVDTYEQYFQTVQQINTEKEELLEWVHESSITKPTWSSESSRDFPPIERGDE